MRVSPKWLMVASGVSLCGGIVGLVLLMRADAEARAPVIISAPGGETITFEYDATGSHTFTSAERRLIEEITTQAFPDVRRVLPDLPKTLVLRVTGTDEKLVVSETGEGGSNNLPDIVNWSVNASRPEGVPGIARTYLRQLLFHELTHIARARTDGFGGQLRYHLMQEGLATAIERDYGGGPDPLWGQYPPAVSEWTEELLAMPKDTPRAPWFTKHADGRRWLGYKVGTYLVDRAAKASGKPVAELIAVPTDALIDLAVGTNTADAGK